MFYEPSTLILLFMIGITHDLAGLTKWVIVLLQIFILCVPTLITVMRSEFNFLQSVPLQAMRLALALTRIH